MISGISVVRVYAPSYLPGAIGSFDLTAKHHETGLVSKYPHVQAVMAFT